MGATLTISSLSLVSTTLTGTVGGTGFTSPAVPGTKPLVLRGSNGSQYDVSWSASGATLTGTLDVPVLTGTTPKADVWLQSSGGTLTDSAGTPNTAARAEATAVTYSSPVTSAGNALGLGTPVVQPDGLTVVVPVTGATGKIGPHAATGFTFNVNTIQRGYQWVAASGTGGTATLTFTLYSKVISTDTVTISYSGGNLVDSTAHTLATVTGASCTNTSTQTASDAAAYGKSVPSTWLTTWAATRALHASQLLELSFMGDSTTYGAGTSGEIGWPYKTRKASVDAGYTNGGQGLIYLSFGSAGETNGWTGYVENLNPFVSGSWTNASNTNYFGPGVIGSNSSDTGGQTTTYQGRGTRIRLYYDTFSTVGDFTYSVDGGAAVTVNAFVSTGSDTGVVDISGLPDGLHTIALTNVGSRAQPQPVWNNSGVQNSAGSGTLAAGTYQYAITAVDASGNETLPTIGTSFTVGTGGRSVSGSIKNTTSPAYIGSTATKYNLYRSIDGSAFQFLSQAAISGTTNFISDDGSITPTATNPPTVATFTRDTSTKGAAIAVEFIRSAGLVFHKDAVTGATFNTFGLDGQLTNNYPHQVSLGLNHAYPATAKLSQPPWRTPRVSVCALGINNQQSGQSDTTLASTGLTTWYNAATLAGAQPLLVIPHYSRSATPTSGKAFVDLARSFAAAHTDVALIDFNVALDAANFGQVGGNPHISQTGYDLEGQYVWDNALGVVSASAGAPAGLTLLGVG